MTTPLPRIELPESMRAPSVRRVMAALGGGKTPPQALFVGGAVRNSLMGEPPGDVDIATIFTPDQVTEKLTHAGIKVVPTGIDHGTVTAVADGVPYEITTLRRDVATDGRRAVVAFTDDWAEDAARRDFTMNALYADEDGNVYDPTGQGVADLTARRVRFVGDASTRVAEDYLRILRFFRFYLYYGRGAPDAAAMAACRAGAPHIKNLSRERVTQELLKILAHDQPAPVLALMFNSGVLSDFPVPAYDAALLSRLEGACAMARLFVLSGLTDRDVTSWLVLSNAQKKHLKDMAAAWAFLMARGAADERTIKEIMYRFGREAARDVEAVWRARVNAEPNGKISSLIKEWEIPVFPVTGHDLIAQGISPGVELGARLKELEEAWIARGFCG